MSNTTLPRPRFNSALARRMRLARGFTVRQVAARVGRAPVTVSAYECRGVMPSPPVRVALERLYGLEPGELLVYDAQGGEE